MKARKAAVVSATLAIVAGACSSGGDDRATRPRPRAGHRARRPRGGASATPAGSPARAFPRPSAPARVDLSLVIWPGYAENGSNLTTTTGSTPFTRPTRLHDVKTKTADTSDDMYNLMRPGARPVRRRVRLGRRLQPPHRRRRGGAHQRRSHPRLQDISPFLQSPPHNTVNGVHYGVLARLGRQPAAVQHERLHRPRPTSWASVFDPAQADAYKGKITDYDGPIYIADAALYLKDTQPELGITDPYELTQPTVRCGRRPAQGAAALRGQVLGQLHRRDRQLRDGTTDDRHRPGSTRSTPSTADEQGRGRVADPDRGRHRLGRYVDDVGLRASIPTACTSGWPGRSSPRSSRSPRSTSARLRPIPAACPQLDTVYGRVRASRTSARSTRATNDRSTTRWLLEDASRRLRG